MSTGDAATHIICPISRQLFCGAHLSVMDGTNEHTVAQAKAGAEADYCPKCMMICRDTLAANDRAHAQHQARVEPMRAARSALFQDVSNP